MMSGSHRIQTLHGTFGGSRAGGHPMQHAGFLSDLSRRPGSPAARPPLVRATSVTSLSAVGNGAPLAKRRRESNASPHPDSRLSAIYSRPTSRRPAPPPPISSRVTATITTTTTTVVTPAPRVSVPSSTIGDTTVEELEPIPRISVASPTPITLIPVTVHPPRSLARTQIPNQMVLSDIEKVEADRVRDARLRLVAGLLLSRGGTRPITRKPPGLCRPYVRSGLSRSVDIEV